MLDKCLPSGGGIWIKMMEKMEKEKNEQEQEQEAERNSRGICGIGSNDMTATCTNMLPRTIRLLLVPVTQDIQ